MADTAFQPNAFQSTAFQEYGGVAATSCDISIAIIQDSDTCSIIFQLPSNEGAGSPAKRRYKKRYQVEVDGQVFEVKSEQEAISLLQSARELAIENAKKVVLRAQKAVNRPKRKILADARKALVSPQIKINRWIPAENIASEIDDIYKEALRIIEIGAYMRLQQEMDDEEVLLLLHDT